MSSVSRFIGVVDYGSGNLRSVCKALEAVGASVALVTKATQLDMHHAIVVPGVGAFGDCAQNLRKSGLWEPLTEWLRLGILPGRVMRFAGSGLKIPHIGWNTLLGVRGPIYSKLPANPYFYFVHSYFPVPANDLIVSARCEYGGTFAASVSSGSLHATQFHPEKSQSAGLALLRNFLDTLA